ncbi:MAG: HU family DNA-binding protein [Muribaculaceae bacterium]
MNSKITFPELIDAVATATNTSKRVSETFLKEMFAQISESLKKGESVKIKRLGTFKLTSVDARKSVNVNSGEEIEIPAHKRIVFTPEKGMADAINMPFASFETIELSDELPEEELKQISESDDESEEIIAESLIAEEIAEPIAKDEEHEEAPVIVESKQQEIEEIAHEEVSEPEPVIELEDEVATIDEPIVANNSFKKGFLWGFVSAIAISFIIVSAFAFVNGLSSNNISQDAITPDTVMTAKAMAPKPTKVLTDTVTKKMFLTTMARKYYGDYNYWVYIYEENKAILKNPNMIEPGTIVVIPDAKKYGIDKNNPESLSKAKSKSYIIFKQFE